jgi:hypothetical protein
MRKNNVYCSILSFYVFRSECNKCIECCVITSNNHNFHLTSNGSKEKRLIHLRQQDKMIWVHLHGIIPHHIHVVHSELDLKNFLDGYSWLHSFLIKWMRFSGPGHMSSVHTLPCMISLMVRVTVGSSLGRGLSMESMLWWCLVGTEGVVWRHSAHFSLRTKQTHGELVGVSRVILEIPGYYLKEGNTT